MFRVVTHQLARQLAEEFLTRVLVWPTLPTAGTVDLGKTLIDKGYSHPKGIRLRLSRDGRFCAYSVRFYFL